MQNIDAQVSSDNRILVITVDLTQDHGPTKTGKTTKVANSGGWTPILIHDGVEYDMNLLIVKKKK